MRTIFAVLFFLLPGVVSDVIPAESHLAHELLDNTDECTPLHSTPEDRERFKEYINYINPYTNEPLDTILEKTGLFFLGSPYVAHTLEVTDEEQLVVNLREFDCVTYIETVIALFNMVKAGENTFEDFAEQLQRVRYRDGFLNGYVSRLHYTSEWVYNNEHKGVLKNISAELGGIHEEKRIDFMSSHRDAYRQLKNDDNVWKQILSIEDEINDGRGFYFLPKNKIVSVAHRIPHMAMIGFTTRIEGLDTTHTGFAFKQGDRLTFIHASSLQKKVVIDQKTLGDYCEDQSSCTGVIVAKVL